MGEVYRATGTKLRRDVAIKVLPDDVAGDRERLARRGGRSGFSSSSSAARIWRLDLGRTER
jgi:hypothetical protein